MPIEPGQPLTYAAAGIDLQARQAVVERYREVAKVAKRPEVLAGIGPFAGLYAMGDRANDMVLVASTDTVGTKGRIASIVNRYEGLGHDIVNHCVNDLFTTGAQPLFFLDTIVNADLSPDAKVALVKGVAEACAKTGMALLGGETADMPGVYLPGGFDLIGSIVGTVERARVIDGMTTEAGDLLFGLPSNGLHTNGYSLARKALGIGLEDGSLGADSQRLEQQHKSLGESLADALLRPHECYLEPLRPALGLIKGMAHITGGSFEENLPRMLKDGLGANLNRAAWPVPAIFSLIQHEGGIEEEEMYRVFNMGLGMVIAVSPDAAGRVRALVPAILEVGEVIETSGEQRVHWT